IGNAVCVFIRESMADSLSQTRINTDSRRYCAIMCRPDPCHNELMLRLARLATHINAEAVNNGLDLLLRQRQLRMAESTPFEIVQHECMFRVRHYPAANHVDARSTPVVLIPPLAVAPSICDLLPQRSLVRHLCAHGF